MVDSTDPQGARVNPDQQFKAYSFALNTGPESAKALQTVCSPYDGKAPDAIFMCAGASRPKYFVEMTEDEFSQGMTNGFWLQAWTAFVSVLQHSCGRLSHNAIRQRRS